MKTDEQLYGDIMDKLEFEPMINPSNITIAVHDGIVTMGGTVSSLVEKRAAERAVNSLYGVKAVANELEVSLSESYKRSDADIAKAALNALKWNVIIPNDKIKVSVEKGHITLTGEVEWWYHRVSTENAVKNLLGVTGITNQIIVKPSISAKDVKNKIIKEFERNAAIDAKNIQVETTGSKVILKGKVNSYAEFQEAFRGAWAVPGVTLVENQLKVSF